MNAFLLFIVLQQVGVNEFNKIYEKYGAMGVLLALLLMYAIFQFREGIRRDKQMRDERKEMIKTHAEEKAEMQQRHQEEMENERERYHEVHQELLSLLKLYTHKHEN